MTASRTRSFRLDSSSSSQRLDRLADRRRAVRSSGEEEAERADDPPAGGLVAGRRPRARARARPPRGASLLRPCDASAIASSRSARASPDVSPSCANVSTAASATVLHLGGIEVQVGHQPLCRALDERTHARGLVPPGPVAASMLAASIASDSGIRPVSPRAKARSTWTRVRSPGSPTPSASARSSRLAAAPCRRGRARGARRPRAGSAARPPSARVSSVRGRARRGSGSSARGGGRGARRARRAGAVLFEPGGEALVQVGAGRLRQRVVGGVADQQVAEAERVLAGQVGPVGPDQPLADERGQPRRQLRSRRVRAPARRPGGRSRPRPRPARARSARPGSSWSRRAASSACSVGGTATSPRPSPRRRSPASPG